jgi:hypothetical protein
MKATTAHNIPIRRPLSDHLFGANLLIGQNKTNVYRTQTIEEMYVNNSFIYVSLYLLPH